MVEGDKIQMIAEIDVSSGFDGGETVIQKNMLGEFIRHDEDGDWFEIYGMGKYYLQEGEYQTYAKEV